MLSAEGAKPDDETVMEKIEELEVRASLALTVQAAQREFPRFRRRLGRFGPLLLFGGGWRGTLPVACFFPSTADQASLSKESIIPTPDRG